MAHGLSVNSRKKRIVNLIKIEVTRRARTETILGKSPAIFNGHQPPRADDPYGFSHIFDQCMYHINILKGEQSDYTPSTEHDLTMKL